MRNEHEPNQIMNERTRAGLTLEELSKKSGIPLSTLGRYQHSDRVPMVALQKIADALNIPMSALMVKRPIPDEDRLTYDQVNLQLQATQQRNIYLTTICDRLHLANRLLQIIAIIMFLFLIYVIIDRFAFPSAGLFHSGG